MKQAQLFFNGNGKKLKSVSIDKALVSPEGMMTCNIDAAFSKKDGRGSFGCLLRDDAGNFIAACGDQLGGALDPQVAEALAFREALS